MKEENTSARIFTAGQLVTIAVHDCQRLFLTPFGVGALCGLLVVGGFFFFQFLSGFNLRLAEFLASPIQLGSARPNLHSDVVVPYLEAIAFVLLFLIPVVMQRLVGDERRDGTDELLLLAGVGERTYGVAKLLAGSAFVVVLASSSLAFPATLFLYGNPEGAPFLVAVVGLGVMLVFFCAFSLSFFLLFPSRGLALVMSILGLLFLYFFHSLKSILPPHHFWWIEALSPVTQAKLLFSGVIAPASLLYFLSYTVLFLSLGIFVLRRERCA